FLLQAPPPPGVRILSGNSTVQFGFNLSKQRPGNIEINLALTGFSYQNVAWKLSGPKSGFLKLDSPTRSYLHVVEPGRYVVQVVAADRDHIASDAVTITVKAK